MAVRGRLFTLLVGLIALMVLLTRPVLAEQPSPTEDVLQALAQAKPALLTLAETSDQPKNGNGNGENPWRLTFGTQFWFAYIPTGPAGQLTTSGGSQETSSMKPDRAIPYFPQYGGSVALSKGPWTFAVGILASDYKMLETQIVTPGFCYVDRFGNCLGTRTQTRWDITRIDFDAALSYAFLDVIKDVLDISVGGGFKWLHLEYEETIISPAGSFFTANGKSKITDGEEAYGVTVPLGFNFHLSNSWYLPVLMTPMVGADTTTLRPPGLTYGLTGDVGLRYVFRNGVSLFGGVRGQYFHGGPTGDYGAVGPIISLSVPIF